MKCPYCGFGNDKQATVCEKCRAGLPAEKPVEQPKKAEKKENKE